MEKVIEQQYSCDPKLNVVLSELMPNWENLVKKAERYIFEIKFMPYSPKTLDSHVRVDYPEMILVDKFGEKLY